MTVRYLGRRPNKPAQHRARNPEPTHQTHDTPKPAPQPPKDKQ